MISATPPPSARARYLRKHPWLRLKAGLWSALETTYIVVGLLRDIPDPVLRREYRRRLLTVLRRRPRVALLRAYAIKCALHFHFDRLVTTMLDERAKIGPEVDDIRPLAPGPRLTERAELT